MRNLVIYAFLTFTEAAMHVIGFALVGRCLFMVEFTNVALATLTFFSTMLTFFKDDIRKLSFVGRCLFSIEFTSVLLAIIKLVSTMLTSVKVRHCFGDVALLVSRPRSEMCVLPGNVMFLKLE